jgi:hypothetical protein
MIRLSAFARRGRQLRTICSRTRVADVDVLQRDFRVMLEG